MTHTKLPWKFKPSVLSGETSSWGTPFIDKKAQVIIPEHFDDEANDDIQILELRSSEIAKFIVRAVNSHDDLVAALDMAYDFMKGHGIGNTGIENILSKAKEQQ